MTAQNKKYLVITSDDFGMCYGVNMGINNAASLGAIKCTNYMVPTPWFEHAVEISKNIKNTDFGIHLTLTNEWNFYKWRPLTSAKTLVDEFGYLKTNVKDLMRNADLDEIVNECYAQIEVAQRKDPRINFIDLHMCIPTISNQMTINPDYEIELLEIIKKISQETGLLYPYRVEQNRMHYFDSHISISGKEKTEIIDYLLALNSGHHLLSCHCSIDTTEQKNFSPKDSDAYPWALEYRLEDLSTITSTWFTEILWDQNIEVINLSDTIFFKQNTKSIISETA